MTSTTFKSNFGTWLGLFCGVVALLICIACSDSVQPSKTDAHPNRVPVVAEQSVPDPEPPKPSPKEQDAAPAPPSEDPPYYGTTIYEGVVTSVYYYPKGPNSQPGTAQTHVKFNHHEEDPETIWLCGDQRSKFEVGNKYRLRVSFEPNEVCITNWTLK